MAATGAATGRLLPGCFSIQNSLVRYQARRSSFDDPAESLEILKPKGGDVFRGVREDGSEAEEVRFERDASGKVVRLIQDSNMAERIAGSAG